MTKLAQTKNGGRWAGLRLSMLTPSLGILRPGIGVRVTRGLMMMGCSMTPSIPYRVLPHNHDGVHVGNHCRSSWGDSSGRGTIGGPVGGVRPQPAGCTVTPETVGTV